MSILVAIETDLAKVAHAFVLGASKLKEALIWAAGEEKKIAPEVAAVENVANAVVASIYPGADKVAIAIEAVFAKALDAVSSLGDAATADAMSIQLDVAAVAAVKAALPIVKAQAATTPGS
jgi:hypothetical protein